MKIPNGNQNVALGVDGNVVDPARRSCGQAAAARNTIAANGLKIRILLLLPTLSVPLQRSFRPVNLHDHPAVLSEGQRCVTRKVTRYQSPRAGFVQIGWVTNAPPSCPSKPIPAIEAGIRGSPRISSVPSVVAVQARC